MASDGFIKGCGTRKSKAVPVVTAPDLNWLSTVMAILQ
jgi:hypothetical protein